MDAQLSTMPIIDVDTHFTEPPDLWTERAPQRLRELAPRVIRNDKGQDTWIVENGLELGPMGYCVIRSDASKEYGTLCLDTFDELHAGASQAKPRLELMDQHGLTMQILYPNILGFAATCRRTARVGSTRSRCCRSGTSTSQCASSSAATISSG
jgi:hypothetical protein